MTKLNLENMSKEELLLLVRQLSNRKKYGLVWEDKPEEVVTRCKTDIPVLEEITEKALLLDSEKPTNILIEGDNYHSLSVLNYTHAGKIDVIYIDPPYNTGASDWKYDNKFIDINDTYRHSKWLSMIVNRLYLAKPSLKPDGVLICAIDENECAHLGVLLEGIFPEYEIHCITIVHNPRGVQGKNFSYTHEYAYFVFQKNLSVIGQRKLREDEIYWSNLRNWGGESLRTDARNCFYPIIVSGEQVIGFGDVCESDFHPEKQTLKIGEEFYIYPVDSKGIERKWRYARQSVEEIKDYLKVKKKKAGFEILIGKDFGTVRTVWQDSKYDANIYGTKLVHDLAPTSKFDFPKSLYNTFDCLSPIIENKKNAVVLDYFAGSGTTGHAVALLNKIDDGNRQYILCTNNENGIAEDVCYPRLKEVLDGNPNHEDITGIQGNLRYFRTTFISKSKVSDDTRRELVRHSTEMICIKENTFEKLVDDEEYKILRDSQHLTGILFKLDAIEAFKSKVNTYHMPISTYVFSLTNDSFDEDFQDLDVQHQLLPIPESILEVYRRLNRE